MDRRTISRPLRLRDRLAYLVGYRPRTIQGGRGDGHTGAPHHLSGPPLPATRKFRLLGMEYEGSVHFEGSAEKAGFKHDIVSRRRLTGFRFRRCAWARGRPVIPREHERGEIDFMRKLDEARERGGPRSEGRRPGIDMADILKAARQRRAVRRLVETGTAAVEHQGHKTAVIGSVTQP